MKKSLTIAVAVLIANVAFAENLMTNGSFDKDIKGIKSFTKIYTYNKETKKWKGEIDKSVNYAKHNVEDGAEGSKGCLEVDYKGIPGKTQYPYQSGVCLTFKRIPGSKAAPAKFKVTFYAKNTGQGPLLLSVTRLWGGTKIVKVTITPEWKKYEATLIAPHPTSTIVICSINNKNKPVSGKFLLDNLTVEKLEK